MLRCDPDVYLGDEASSGSCVPRGCPVGCHPRGHQTDEGGIAQDKEPPETQCSLLRKFEARTIQTGRLLQRNRVPPITGPFLYLTCSLLLCAELGYDQTGCTLQEAAIVASVLAKVKVPLLHSAAALLKLAEMDYSGTMDGVRG